MEFTENREQGVQPYKYNGKELDTKHGLNMYDYSAKYYEPSIGRFSTVDPMAEKYYSISPYAYCNNNPLKFIDPTGMDYWSTSDPEEIARFLRIYNRQERSPDGFSNISYARWIHIKDNEFVGNLTFNDETQTFYSSYLTKEGNDYVVNGISI